MPHLPSNNFSKILKIRNFLHVSTVIYNAVSYIHKRNSRIQNTISKKWVVISKTSQNRIYCHRKNPERPAQNFDNNTLLPLENVHRIPFWSTLLFSKIWHNYLNISLKFSKNFNKMFKKKLEEEFGRILLKFSEIFSKVLNKF